MGELDGKVALVTGGARGQGRAHALALAAAGADVAVLDVCRDLPALGYHLATKADLDEVVAAVEELDRRALPLVADVRSEHEVAAAVAAAADVFGRLDIVVNNAAVATTAPFWRITEQQWDDVVDSGLKGVWLVSKHAAPLLMDAPDGRLVHIASAGGVRGVEHFAHYVAAKHGVVGLTRTMAIELAPHGVTVNAILPGAVASPMLAGLAEEQGLTPDDVHRTFLQPQLLKEVLDPAEISAALLWLVSRAARHVTGQCVGVDGGATV